MKTQILLVWIGAVLFATISGHAAPNEQKEIQELYRRGLAGDKEAVDSCIRRLEDVLQIEPANQLARVYLGSAYTLRSRDLGFGPKKLQALQHGLALMDEAVTAAPAAAKVRLARALTTLALPSIFGRAGSTRKDFEQLAASARTQPAQFEEGDLQIIYYNAGLAAKAAGDRTRAVVLFKEGARHPANPDLARKLQAALAGRL